ncbi:MAG: hypothetical protein J5486_02220 [Bacteroidaceae bacterium]|nr:hypothetical protein [Bacteroidaceae bacterium]
MNINNISFPYPVLGINGDVLPEPTCEVVKGDDKESFFFNIKLTQENETINKLIAEDYADIFCEIDCPSSYFRQCWSGKDTSFSVTIPKKSVRAKIWLLIGIVVKKRIDDYQNDGFHEDYKGFSFVMEPGDLLGVFGQYDFDADIKYDKLQAVNTFMEIRENKEDEETRYDLTNDKIRIYLPTQLFTQYQRFAKSGFSDIIHSSIVYNAMLHALCNWNEIDTSSGSYPLWARTIWYRLKTEEEFKEFGITDEIPIQDVYRIVQKLLKDPYKRMFDNICDLQGTDSILTDD